MTAEKQPPAPAANDERSALTDLKTLLLGPEQASIEVLQREAQDQELQAQRVADTLPDSLHRAHGESPEDLARALEKPVSACIEDSVQRNPGFFADILFPVMGPAIRRSISQALKGLVQQINQTLEHSLTVKGMRWRLEAARSGVPFAEVVLRHTLRFRVEEAFLIQGGSGLLIQHVGQGATDAKDADAVSAMLTALRDFTRDTLRDEDDESRLETIDVGDHTLWLVHGPRAYVACAIRGVPPVSLRDDLNAIVEEIHHRHARLLETFDGDAERSAPLIPLLERCLQSEVEERAKKRSFSPLLLVLLVLGGLLAWWLFGLWQDGTQQRQHAGELQAALGQLRQAPGIVVTDGRIADGRLQVQGLHDPLLPAPEALLEQAGIDKADVELAFRPFQSAEPEAALARARQRLAAPPQVELELGADGTLQARGIAPTTWTERAALLATTVPGIQAFDGSGLEDTDRRLERQLREATQPPEQVAIRVTGGHAVFSGSATLAWIQALSDAPPALPGLLSLDSGSLLPLERARFDQLVEQINESSVPFEQGIEYGELQQARVDETAELIGEAFRYASDLDLPMRLQVIGRTDGTGSVERNITVGSQRAKLVADALLLSTQPMPPLDLRAVTQPPSQTHADLALRRVEFRVTGTTPTEHAATP